MVNPNAFTYLSCSHRVIALKIKMNGSVLTRFVSASRAPERALDCFPRCDRGLVDLHAIIVEEELRELRSHNERLWNFCSLKNKELEA